MRILAIVYQYPEYDRESGALRFFQMLRMLARRHEVTLCCYMIPEQLRYRGAAEVQRYRRVLSDIGVRIADLDLLHVLRRDRFDALLFEFYRSASRYLDEARLLQKRAITIVDSVDVAFNRLFARARVTGSAQDLQAAEEVKRTELECYRKADHVITVTDQDRRLLLADEPGLHVGVVPNIHVIQPLDDASGRERDSLLFVGGFLHEPNTDAVQYFCREIMPLIWREVPMARLRIIGDSPPDVVRKLAGDRIEVLGYVPDLEPYLRTSRVSVAPLRYGGGMKGKIGEAMAAGLPVVSTSSGIEGFGLTPGQDVLVADKAEDFSAAVVRLLRDRAAYDAVRKAGWQFITDRFSPEAVEAELLGFFERVATMPVRRPSLRDRVKMAIPAPLRYLIRDARDGAFRSIRRLCGM